MIKNNKLILLVISVLFSVIAPLNLHSRHINFKIKYKNQNVNIDSIILVGSDFKRIGVYKDVFSSLDTVRQPVFVFYFGKTKICTTFYDYKLECDTTVLDVEEKFVCKKRVYTIGTFQTCNGLNANIAFFSDYYPCCSGTIHSRMSSSKNRRIKAISSSR